MMDIFLPLKKKKKPQNIYDKWAPGDKAKSNAIIVTIPALDSEIQWRSNGCALNAV